MSISDRRAELTARTLAHALLEKEMVSGVTEDALTALIVRVLAEDRRLEQEVDEAAKLLMQKHAAAIARESMDTGALYRKFRAQLAKEKGFVP
jgi:hypothetical protein